MRATWVPLIGVKEAQAAPQGPDAPQRILPPKRVSLPVWSISLRRALVSSSFGSNEFLADDTLQIESMLSGTRDVAALQVVENTLDWATEDQSLLAIRGRGTFCTDA